MSAHDGGPAECMSLRDYFAAAALQGMIGDSMHERVIETGACAGMTERELTAIRAYEYADAMLAERERKL